MEITKVTKSSNITPYSLRTTLPKYICKLMELKEADHLIWKTEDNKIIISKQNE